MIKIDNINQLKDNYTFSIINNDRILIVDPADSVSILKYINDNKFSLKAILLTHHHADHTAGVSGILNEIQVPVYSPNKDIEHTTNLLKDGDSVNLNFINFELLATPGHTMDHIVYYNKKNNLLFSGDTLFRLGCGRIFEGTKTEMYNSLRKINALDNHTNVYCGHEYTLTNLNFLLSIFPTNKNLITEKEKINKQIKEFGSSVPFNLGSEKLVNPFLSPDSQLFTEFRNEKNFNTYELFSHLRDLKNGF